MSDEPSLIFEWDEKKNQANKREHRVSFEEAKSAFQDTHALVSADEEHSQHEHRFHLLGVSQELRLLLVVHSVRSGNTIRLISAWKATMAEKRAYNER